MPIATAVDLWGPCAWKFLHAISFTYPTTPTDDDKKGLADFMNGLPTVIPCPACGKHAQQYFDNNRDALTRALDSGPALQRFMHAFHNSVNASRSPPVPPMDFERVRQLYTYGHELGRARPSTQTEWADPYHNMPPWNRRATSAKSLSVFEQSAVSEAAFVIALVIAAYYTREFLVARTRTRPPRQQRAGGGGGKARPSDHQLLTTN